MYVLLRFWSNNCNNYNILWDFSVITDRIVWANCPDLILETRQALLMDFSCPFHFSHFSAHAWSKAKSDCKRRQSLGVPMVLYICYTYTTDSSALPDIYAQSSNRIQANILYKQTCSQGLHQRNLMIFGTFRNAVTRYTHCGQCNIKDIALTTVHISR